MEPLQGQPKGVLYSASRIFAAYCAACGRFESFLTRSS
jgi:hypothetical protein